MKVLMLIDTEGIGGAETAVVNQALALVSRGWEVEVVNLRESPFVGFARKHGLVACALPMQGRTDLSIVKRLSEYVKVNKIDLIHSHLFKADLVAAVVSKLTKIPCVLTTHGFLTANTNIKPLRLRAYEVVNKFIGNSHSRVFAVSRDIQQYWLDYGLTPEQAVFIPNSIDCERFSPGQNLRNSIRARYGIAGDETCFGVVARLSPEKGHQYLLRAIALVKARLPELKAKFILAGSGGQADCLVELARELGIEEQVIFTGHLENVQEIYQALDVLVLPSITEGLPLVLLEGMAMEKVVIASAVGGIPEVIEHLHNGLLVKPADPESLAAGIHWVKENFEAALKLGKNSRTTVTERFSLAANIAKLEENYRQVLAEVGR